MFIKSHTAKTVSNIAAEINHQEVIVFIIKFDINASMSTATSRAATTKTSPIIWSDSFSLTEPITSPFFMGASKVLGSSDISQYIVDLSTEVGIKNVAWSFGVSRIPQIFR